MASIRGILNIQSLNELTSENKLIVTPAEDAVDPTTARRRAATGRR